MARITLLSWNIEVYGPTKYTVTSNAYRLTKFVAATIVETAANLVVLMELSDSVADQICQSLVNELYTTTKNKWKFVTIPAKPAGDRERYGFLWRQAGVPFGEINAGNGKPYIRLSGLGFPNNWGQLNGRRAAMAAFRATDTNVTFTVSVYHAPPPYDQNSTYAHAGVEALAKSADLYRLDLPGQMGNVTGRMLAGDYNLDVNHDLSFSWLTNDVPAQPPPARAGQGAGTTPISDKQTHLISMEEVKRRWGGNINGWGMDPKDYLELPIDDIFYAPRYQPQRAGGVFNLMQQIMAPDTDLRARAQNFETRYMGIMPAFPNAEKLWAQTLAESLDDPRYAWLLLRYAISDHLPVYASIDI